MVNYPKKVNENKNINKILNRPLGRYGKKKEWTGENKETVRSNLLSISIIMTTVSSPLRDLLKIIVVS